MSCSYKSCKMTGFPQDLFLDTRVVILMLTVPTIGTVSVRSK